MDTLIDCPACEGLHPAGQVCECGHCSHDNIAGDGICATCGIKIEPSFADLVGELLDAADAFVTEMRSHQSEQYWRLRFAVTRMQGLAGIRVTSQEAKPC